MSFRSAWIFRGMAVLMAAGIGTTVACGGAGEPKAASDSPLAGYNVVVIVVDALRADHLGCYGYGRNTSPFLDRVASEGVLFERAVSNSSYTCESVASLFMGRLPGSTAWSAGWYARPDPAVKGMGALFGGDGYATALLSNTPMLNHAAFFRGFDEAECLDMKFGISGAGPKLTERALRFVREHSGERCLLYLHYLDPHAPYDPPEAYYRRFADEVYEHPLNLYGDVREHVPELVRGGFGPGEARFEDLVLRYDAEIAFIDDSIRQLFEGLRRLGTLDKTLVVFTSDHGEEFLEHGYIEHAWRLYWESIHVPLIFWAPGVLRPARFAEPVSLVDILPSLTALTGVASPENTFDGAALFEPRPPGWQHVPHGRPIVSELLIPSRNIVRSVLDGNHHYLAAQKWLTEEELALTAGTQRQVRKELLSGTRTPVALCGPVVREELFDLDKDPDEKRALDVLNVAGGEALRDRLHSHCAKSPAQVPDRFKAEGKEDALTEEQRAKLQALGYLDGDTQERDEEGRAPESPTESEEQLKNLGYL